MNAEDNERHQATQHDEQTKLDFSRRNVLLAGTAVTAATAFGPAAPIQRAQAQQVPAAPAIGNAPDRTMLPLAEPTHPPITELDVRKATAPPRFEVKAPQGAPNVMVILLDNLGYDATKTFGGIMNMPTLERLAKDGLV
jgi:hypothetical protein